MSRKRKRPKSKQRILKMGCDVNETKRDDFEGIVS